MTCRPPDPRQTVTLAAAARALEVSRTTVYKWIAAGALRVLYIGPPGHQIARISQTELRRLIALKRSQGEAETRIV